MRVALIHDWLLGMRGGERCLEVLCAKFPEADVYTAFYQADNISDVITRHRVISSPLNRLPFVAKYYRHLLPVFPFAARSLGRALARRHKQVHYDLVISVSHCLAKNVPTPPDLPHLCYCLTPMRYLWDQYDAYFSSKKLEPVIRRIVQRLQRWDRAGAKGVHSFIAISEFVRERIAKVYACDAEVIYPPVKSDWITPRDSQDAGCGFLCVSALVPYKNVEVIVRAFNSLPYRLTVVGSGPESQSLRKQASSNITFLEHISDGDLAHLYKSSKALIFAAEEDFGMTPVEMQAAGRPVICYGRGGALETVRAESGRPSGLYFPDLNPDAIRAAVEDFTIRQAEFSVENCLEKANEFSFSRFKHEFDELLLGVVPQRSEKPTELKSSRAVGL